METVHSALDASIYQALNDGPHLKVQIVDPKSFGPKWLLLSRPESRSDPIGGSEPVSGTRDRGWDSLPDFFFF